MLEKLSKREIKLKRALMKQCHQQLMQDHFVTHAIQWF